MVRRPRDSSGQTTVELALALPILALVLSAFVEAGMIGLDQLRLWHAAREAARVGVVDADLDSVRAAAERSGLRDLEMTVEPEVTARTAGEPLSVRLTYRPRGHVPVIGAALFGSITLDASATMRIERP
jgi:TadE-like protein